MGRGHYLARRAGLAIVAGCLLAPFVAASAQAAVLTQSGTVNVSATVLPTVPTEAAFIDQPQTNTHVPITTMVVKGRCGAGLLVRIFDNGQLAGSVVCEPDSTFTANIVLNPGKNVLSVFNYDAFEQKGPSSPDITVYVDTPPAGTAPQNTSQEITQTVGSEQPANNPAFDPTRSAERIFEGTVLEPIAKLLDLNSEVSSGTNQATAIAMNSAMAIGVLVLIALLIL
jgi:hypothetical protein